MIKKINLEKLLMFFILLQPFLDFYLLYSERVTSIFRFSPTTIIRILFVGLFAIYLLFKIKYNKKYLWILGYLLIILIYLIFHVFNSLNFNINIGNNYAFSFVTEAFYFIRMFIPIILIFVTYNIKPKEKTFEKTIIGVSLIFSLVIIITNFFKISLTSYGGNNLILGNIVDWFLNSSYKFEDLASKGFFYSANQISAALIMLLPINIYYAIKTSKKVCIFSSFCLCLSMIMIGTRVVVYGWFLISVAVFIAWIFFSLIHRNKIGITRKKIMTYLVLFVILTVLTINCPLVLRETSTDFAALEAKNITKEINAELYNVKNREEKENFIVKYCETFSIPSVYIEELYKYKNDSNFWIETMKLPYNVRGGNRNIQNLITKRIYNLNNNKYDKFLGMGYSRFRNAELYIEQDFIVHFYTLGIMGIILFLSPYLVISTFSLVYMLINKTLRMKTTILCMSVYLTLAISIFSGHVLDELIVTIILGFISGYILILTLKKDSKESSEVMVKKYKENKTKLSVIVPIYNVEKYLSKCLDSLVNQTLNGIQIILIDDGSKDSSPSICDEYAKKYKNIIVKHIENGGVANARNVGLSCATGEYIAFLDSDDYIELNMYELMYNKAISQKTDIVGCNVDIVYPTYNTEVSSGMIECNNNEELKKNILINSYAVIWNKIYKKSLIHNIKFKDKCNFCEDVDFLYKVLPLANSFSSIDIPLHHYIQREGSLTYVYDKKLYQLIDIFDGLVKLYNEDKKYKKYKEELEYSYVRYLYATFIKRLAKTKNKIEFKKGVDIVIDKVNRTYPNYKKNKYIKKLSFKSLYLKNFNKLIANIIYVTQKNKMN